MTSTLSRVRDVVVIGAGPAGTMTALLLARSGIRVTLVDRKTFPRSKVCGGCLNAQAVAALADAGVLGRLRSVGARDTHTIDVRHGRSTTTLALPGRSRDLANDHGRGTRRRSRGGGL